MVVAAIIRAARESASASAPKRSIILSSNTALRRWRTSEEVWRRRAKKYRNKSALA